MGSCRNSWKSNNYMGSYCNIGKILTFLDLIKTEFVVLVCISVVVIIDDLILGET